jgi:hypothetical protein
VCALGLNRTTTTRLFAELDLDDGFTMVIQRGQPVQTGLASGASGLLRIPVNHEIVERKALPLTRLPPRILPRRTKQINLIVALTGDDRLRTHVATVDDMDSR